MEAALERILVINKVVLMRLLRMISGTIVAKKEPELAHVVMTENSYRLITEFRRQRLKAGSPRSMPVTRAGISLSDGHPALILQFHSPTVLFTAVNFIWNPVMRSPSKLR